MRCRFFVLLASYTDTGRQTERTVFQSELSEERDETSSEAGALSGCNDSSALFPILGLGVGGLRGAIFACLKFTHTCITRFPAPEHGIAALVTPLFCPSDHHSSIAARSSLSLTPSLHRCSRRSSLGEYNISFLRLCHFLRARSFSSSRSKSWCSQRAISVRVTDGKSRRSGDPRPLRSSSSRIHGWHRLSVRRR